MVFWVVSRITKQFGHSVMCDLELAAQLQVHRLIEIIVELLQKLLTGKQKRRPLSA